MARGVFASVADQTRICALESCAKPYTPRQDNQLYCCVSHKKTAMLRRRYDAAFGNRIAALEDRVAKLERGQKGKSNA